MRAGSGPVVEPSAEGAAIRIEAANVVDEVMPLFPNASHSHAGGIAKLLLEAGGHFVGVARFQRCVRLECVSAGGHAAGGHVGLSDWIPIEVVVVALRRDRRETIRKILNAELIEPSTGTNDD